MRLRRLGVPVLLLSVFLAACAVFWLAYQADNKYTAAPGQPVRWLISDWEIYRGRLLTPDDFAGENAPLPDEIVFIGQYGGFEGRVDGVPERSPHGSASYRLLITLPDETASYTLELPEIFSAYKLYINGLPAAEMGETDPARYRAHTGIRTVTVLASGQMDILAAVSNFSHFYSGMVYPPAFGDPDAVAGVLNLRLAVRYIAGVTAACLGLLYFGIWLLTRKERKPLYYAALCLCFVLYTCHPIVKTLLPGGMLWYTVENVAYCAVFLFVMLIQRHLTGMADKWFRPFGAFAVFVICWALSMPFLAGDNLNMMMAYSRLIEAYSWVCALFLTIGAAVCAYKGRASGSIMLAAMMVMNAALVMGRVFPMFEPIRFGWFPEIAGAFVVLMIGAALAGDIAAQYRLRQAIESRAESVSRMLDVQRAGYPKLLEKEEQLETARHNLRHHMLVIRELAAGGGKELEAYLNDFEDSQPKTAPVLYCEHYIVNTLLEVYANLAKRQDTVFLAQAKLPASIPVKDADLSVLLSNLLENALEASLKIPVDRRAVSVTIGQSFEMLGIHVKNTFDGNVRKADGRFFSSKRADREGVGLVSARAICRLYGGSAEFYTDGDNTFHSEIILPLAAEKGGA